MSTVEIAHLSSGWREILNSADVKALCDETGQAIAARAGDGFAYVPVKLGYGGGRVGGFIVAETYEAMRAEAEDKVLTQAVWP